MRNKWKRNYDDKLKKLFGVPHQTAFSKLHRIIIFEQAKELGKDKCYHCGFPIESVDQMSIEHKRPYGGNVAKDIPEDINLFWDYSNIAFSHKWCNCSNGPGGSGTYKYIGIHDFYDNRKNPPYHYIRAEINIGKKGKVMGCYKTDIEAAIAYDLGGIIFKKGICKLNFEVARQEYQEAIKNHEYLHDITIDNLSKLKNSRDFIKAVKGLVEHFYPRILQGIKNQARGWW